MKVKTAINKWVVLSEVALGSHTPEEEVVTWITKVTTLAQLLTVAIWMVAEVAIQEFQGTTTVWTSNNFKMLTKKIAAPTSLSIKWTFQQLTSNSRSSKIKCKASTRTNPSKLSPNLVREVRFHCNRKLSGKHPSKCNTIKDRGLQTWTNSNPTTQEPTLTLRQIFASSMSNAANALISTGARSLMVRKSCDPNPHKTECKSKETKSSTSSTTLGS